MGIFNSWKLNWVFSQFRQRTIKRNRTELKRPWHYLYLLVRLLAKTGGPGTVALRKGGKFRAKDLMTLYIYSEIFVNEEYRFDGALEPGSCVINIGANTGLFDIWIKQKFPGIAVYSFEPFKDNYLQLTENINISGLKDVHTFQKGVGATTRTEKLYIHPTNLGAHSIIQEHTHSDNFIAIDLISLEEVYRLIGTSPCSLLKADCEGSEYEILKSMTPEQAQRTKRIIYEPSEHLYNPDEVDTHLRSLGYTITKSSGTHVAVRQ